MTTPNPPRIDRRHGQAMALGVALFLLGVLTAILLVFGAAWALRHAVL